jgi:hypothetical protein
MNVSFLSIGLWRNYFTEENGGNKNGTQINEKGNIKKANHYINKKFFFHMVNLHIRYNLSPILHLLCG